MFAFLYEFFLILIGIACLPKLLYQWVFKKKYRDSLFKRFGWGFPEINKGGRQLIWVHAVSLGETRAVAALVKTLKTQTDNPIIVFSTTTETGNVEAGRTIGADHVVYLPFDFGWVVRGIIKKVAPDLVILCESDFWYNFLDAAKQQGAVTILVNGKLSISSMQRFGKFPFFTKRLFSLLDLLCVQSHLYRQRFEAIGVPSDKIVVTGNMKFDGDYGKLPLDQLESWRQELGLQKGDPVLVIGSSHHPEEVQLLEVLAHVWKTFPSLRVLLVPRHPERFNDVATLLQRSQIPFRRLSQKNAGVEAPQVVLIDAMGLLRKCYQLADIAIVAGSYTAKVGGHNILEPSWYGVPVVFGPCMASQPDLVELVKEYHAGMQVPLEQLSDVLLDLLKEPSRRQALGGEGLRLVSDIHGATNKTFESIKKQMVEMSHPLVVSSKK